MNDYFNVSARGSNTVFENADFSDLWAEYDEAISAVVQVEDPRLDIVKSKDKWGNDVSRSDYYYYAGVHFTQLGYFLDA